MTALKKTIISIDDDKKVLKLLKAFLHNTEFNLKTADDVYEGIRMIKKMIPDIILMDVMMPKLNGYKATRILKRVPETKHIPIIFLTALKSKLDVGTAMESGGSGFIVKPFNPTDLLAKLRNVTKIHPAKKKAEKDDKSGIENLTDKPIKKGDDLSEWIATFEDVAVFRPDVNMFTIHNWKFFRDVFAQLFEDKYKKIIFDMSEIKKIDAAGLGLLISVNETLKKSESKLNIIIPDTTLSSRFSYVSISDLFKVFVSQVDAVNNYDRGEGISGEDLVESLNVCTACRFINNFESNFCGYCGTNLILGKGDDIARIIKIVILKSIKKEIDTFEQDDLNKKRNLKIEEEEIPSVFNVELFGPNFSLKYRNNHIYTELHKSKGLLGIQAPTLYKKTFPFKPGLEVIISSIQPIAYSSYSTKIHSVNHDNNIIYIHYSDDANILTSSKNFSVSPKVPLNTKIINPKIGFEGDVILGKIIDICRIRMSVFVELDIPENECLAVSFNLPNGDEVSSPIVIAKRRDGRFTYDFEFKVIDESERSKLIQYMYKRQIEMAKTVIQ